MTLEKQIQASKSQQEQISLQNSENIFFQLLKTKKDSIDSIYYEIRSFRDEKYYTGQNAIKELTQNLQHQSGVIAEYYNQELLEYFPSYFRIVYETIKTIDDFIINTDEKNIKYIDILGATFTNNELKILFFYCLIDEKFKVFAEKFCLFKSLSVDNLNMNENWEPTHMLTSHAFKFSSEIFGENEQWIKYFKDLEKISLNLDPDNITKRINLIYEFKFHINRYSDHSALYNFQTLDKINNYIQETIHVIKDKNVELHQEGQEKNFKSLDDLQKIQQLNSIEIDESLYYLIIYRIDYKEFMKHKSET